MNHRRNNAYYFFFFFITLPTLNSCGGVTFYFIIAVNVRIKTSALRENTGAEQDYGCVVWLILLQVCLCPENKLILKYTVLFSP